MIEGFRRRVFVFPVLLAGLTCVAASPAAEEAAEKYSGDCARSGCHEEIAKRPHVHGPVSVGKCDACHRPVAGQEHEFELPREEKDLCTFCHDLDEKKAVIHKPYQPDGCAGCHDPHGGKLKGFLVEESLPKLCAACHTPQEMEASKHKPFEDGECLQCHEPHQGEHKKLLAAAGTDLCAGCHGDLVKSIRSSAHPHEPAAKDCGGCHVGHTGPNPKLLAKPSGELCGSCHGEVAKTVKEAAVVHGPLQEGQEGCPACHLPHASESEGLTKGDTPLGLCLSCHNREIAGTKGRRLANVGREIQAGEFRHGPVAKDRCAGCHEAHAGAQVNLLVEKYAPGMYVRFSEDEYALCFTCHDKKLVAEDPTDGATGFRDGKRNLHALHVKDQTKGRSCRICHEAHASSLPHHLRREIPFGKGGWRLPIGYERTQGGGKCASGCHLPKTYARPEPPAPPPADSAAPAAPADPGKK